ncbi:MAG: O-antigen ligase family protein [Chitinophagaceae bacterium]|nr:O-antigen ligase family protein [Chitinophagaceae bacterium]
MFILSGGIFLLSLMAAVYFDEYYLLLIPFAGLFMYAGWQQVNAVFFLLLITLPFSAEWQVAPSLGTDFPDEPLMLFTAGLFFCYWLYSPKILPAVALRHPLILLLLITLIWASVAALFSTHSFISLKFLLAKSWYIGAFILAPLIVFREKKNSITAILLLALSMLAVTIITMVRHYQYAFSFAGINDALQPFFRNHVNYSAMLVCMIPVFFAWYKLSKSKTNRYLLLTGMIVLLVALFFSYARGAWLALITGTLAYWLIRKKWMISAYITAIVIGIASLFWIRSNDRYLQYAHDYRSTVFHENFREHLRATYEFKDVSTAERFYRWIAGVRMIKDDPLTGFGPATFYTNYKPYTVPAFKTWVSNNPEHSTVHNYFLLITIEQGIPGLLFFLLLTTVMFGYAQQLYHRVNDPFYKMTAITSGVVLTMILTVNFLSDLIETDKIGSIFFLCLSLLVISDINTRKLSSDPSPDIQRIP